MGESSILVSIAVAAASLGLLLDQCSILASENAWSRRLVSPTADRVTLVGKSLNSMSAEPSAPLGGFLLDGALSCRRLLKYDTKCTIPGPSQKLSHMRHSRRLAALPFIGKPLNRTVFLGVINSIRCGNPGDITKKDEHNKDGEVVKDEG